MKEITISESLYFELVEYLDDRADIGEWDVPNTAMQLLTELQKAFEKSQTK